MGATWVRYLPLVGSVLALFDAGVVAGVVGVAGEASLIGAAPSMPLDTFVARAARQLADYAQAELSSLGEADAEAVEARVEQLVTTGERTGLLAAAILGHRAFEHELIGDGSVAFDGLHADARGYMTLLIGQLHAAVLRFARDPEVFPSASTRALRDLGEALSARPTYAQVRLLVEMELARRPPQLIDGDRPRLVARFVAREQLTEVHKALENGGVASVSSLTGMRGVGKSQLAAAYAQACEHAGWTVVVWVSGQTREQAVAQLAGIARRAGIAGQDSDAEDAASTFLSWIAARGGDRLVVFDNIEAVDDLQGLLPRGPGTRVLATTTLRTDAFGKQVDIGVFTREQAASFLVDSTGINDPDGAAQVADDLGRLPVALAQAATAVTARGYDFASYRRVLAEYPLDEAVRLEDGGYPELAGVALWLGYQTVLERLASRSTQLGEAARAVLAALALLAESGVERDWLYAAVDDEARGREAVGELIRSSLATASTGGETVSVHRLQARVIRDDLADDRSALRAAVAVLSSAARSGTTSDFHVARARNRSLAAQLTALRAQPGSRDLRTHPRVLTLAQALTYRLNSLGDPRAATALSGYLDDCKQVLGPDHPDTLRYQNNLAVAHASSGDLNRAIALHETTLADRERVLGTNHPSTLTSRNNLAAAYRSAGNLKRAIALLETTLADRERVLGTNHPDTLSSRNNLAAAYASSGNASRAVVLLEATAADCDRLLGSDHPNTLMSCNNLAVAYASSGDLNRAIALHETTLANRERVLGTDHPDTLTSRNNLADTHRMAGDVRKAIDLHESTLTQREQVLGTDHPDTLTSRNNLADTYRMAGYPMQAIALYETTLVICERVLGPEHATTAATRQNLRRAREN